MWNDIESPLAYLITFRCHGTWLHGDERGSVDRFHNHYNSPYIEPSRQWYRYNRTILRGEPVKLTASRRASVETAIRETCNLRNWFLHAINVRTNHVHAVVSIGSLAPQRALSGFKANATRHMRHDGCWVQERSPWVVKGSVRYLWNERSVTLAIDYVINGQGNDLPEF